MKTLTVNINPAYEIIFDEHLLENSQLAEFCHQQKKRIAIITDSNLVTTHAESVKNYLEQYNVTVEIFTFPAGESHKNRETKAALEDQLLAKQYGRDTCLIAVGGGVVTDLVGFVAATYCRGINSIYIPTTLLAMVDAAVGGKTGVNTPFGKNLIGAFYQPKAVFINPQFLTTLPNADFKDGLSETIKHALIADKAMFKLLMSEADNIQARQPDVLSELIFRCCDIKRHVVEQDVTEQGVRQILNFGHTIAHAIEMIEDYKISHGQAVAIGIAVESYLSLKVGYLSQQDFDQIMVMLQLYYLNYKTQAFTNLQRFQDVLILDKKSKQRQPYFILLNKIGEVHHQDEKFTFTVSESLLEQVLAWGKEICK